MKAIVRKLREAVKPILIILLVMFLWAQLGIAIGVVLHMQLMLWAIVIGGIVRLVTGIRAAWEPLVIVFDMMLLVGVGGLFAWLLSRRDAYLLRLVRSAMERLRKVVPDWVPDEEPRFFVVLGLLSAFALLPATAVVFYASTFAWEAYAGRRQRVLLSGRRMPRPSIRWKSLPRLCRSTPSNSSSGRQDHTHALNPRRGDLARASVAPARKRTRLPANPFAPTRSPPHPRSSKRRASQPRLRVDRTRRQASQR